MRDGYTCTGGRGEGGGEAGEDERGVTVCAEVGELLTGSGVDYWVALFQLIR